VEKAKKGLSKGVKCGRLEKAFEGLSMVGLRRLLKA